MCISKELKLYSTDTDEYPCLTHFNFRFTLFESISTRTDGLALRNANVPSSLHRDSILLFCAENLLKDFLLTCLFSFQCPAYSRPSHPSAMANPAYVSIYCHASRALQRLGIIRYVLLATDHWSLVSRFARDLVGSSGFEPPTSCLSGARSNHLSYEPDLLN